jgi:glutathione S-transferase
MTQTVNLELLELGPDTHGLESISPFCLKVHRALKFYGLNYERRHAMRPSQHKKYNPTGQAPVLLIDGKPVPDSTEIIKALDALGTRSLVPAERRQRAEAWFWEDYADRVLGYFVFAARWFDDRNWEALSAEQFGPMPRFLKPWLPNRVRKRLLKSMGSMEFIRIGQAACWKDFQEHLDLLDDSAPETGFWVGAQITVADIGLFAILHSMRSDLSQWQMDQINQRPKLRAWLDRVDADTR